MIILVTILSILSGLCEAIMDTLLFHYNNSIFKGFKNQTFWNPEISWRNKYKDGDPEKGPKFLFSTTLLVSFTDAWHRFKNLRNIFMLSNLVILSYYGFTNPILPIFLIICGFGLAFNLGYKKIFLDR